MGSIHRTDLELNRWGGTGHAARRRNGGKNNVGEMMGKEIAKRSIEARRLRWRIRRPKQTVDHGSLGGRRRRAKTDHGEMTRGSRARQTLGERIGGHVLSWTVAHSNGAEANLLVREVEFDVHMLVVLAEQLHRFEGNRALIFH